MAGGGKRRIINQLPSAVKRPCEGGKRPAASSGKGPSSSRASSAAGAGTSSSTQQTTKKAIPRKEAMRVTAMRARAAQNKQSRQQHKRSSSKASPLPVQANRRKPAGKKPTRMSKSKVKKALAFHGITSDKEHLLMKTTSTGNDDDKDDGKKRTTTWDTIVPLLIEVEQANTAKNSRGKHVWELPTKPFRRVMEEISQGLNKEVCFEEGAVEVLKSISEEVLTGLFTKAMKAAQHRGRKTLMLKNLAYVRDATHSQPEAGDLANIMPMCLDEAPVLS